MELEVDHLVVAARTLQEGVEHVCEALGVTEAQFAPEGKHPMWGTHNRCLALDQSGAYLEVIAVDPSAAAPPRPRWFGLDDAAVAAALKEHGALLLHWVARVKRHTGDLAEAREQRPGAVPPLVSMERGPYCWRIGVPEDGGLPAAADGAPGGGLVPTLIQWDCAQRPSEALPPTGLRLLRLTGRHVRAEAVRQALAAQGAEGLLTVEEAPSAVVPSLHASIWNPQNLRGVRTLF